MQTTCCFTLIMHGHSVGFHWEAIACIRLHWFAVASDSIGNASHHPWLNCFTAECGLLRTATQALSLDDTGT